MPQVRNRPTRGFTLVELLVVMVIIGILISLILVAAIGGVRRAEERATQALLIKLDTGLSDRVEALLTSRVTPNPAHAVRWPRSSLAGRDRVEGRQRAQVIATYDMMRAELPDVFYIPSVPTRPMMPCRIIRSTSRGSRSPATRSTGDADYVLPLGARSAVMPGTGIYGASYTAAAGIYKNLGYVPAGYDGVDNNGNGVDR